MTRPPTRYFGGHTVTDGRVHRLACDTFKELVSSQIFVPVSFRLKRHEFLNHPDRDRAKDGSFITAATYDEEECPRGNANATGFTMVLIDMDGAEAKDFANSPSTIRDALSGLNFVAWTTAKHTPDEPRIKIAVDCLTAPKEFYRNTVNHVFNLLGLPPKFKGRQESYTLSLPQYRPLHFAGEEYSAVIAHYLDGKPLDPFAIEKIAEEEGADGTTKYAYTPSSPAEEAMAEMLLNLPLRDITVEDVREPLLAIDPDIGYCDWVAIAASLRHNFTDEDDAREAFELYNEWSSGGKLYKGREECLSKWRSFKPYPEGRAAITLRTLFHFAMNAGWKNDRFVKKQLDSFSEWCVGQDVTTLMSEGVKRIAAAAIRTEMNDEMLAEELLKALKNLGAKPSKVAVLKDVKSLRRQERMETAAAATPPWMLPFCFIGPEDRFRNVLSGMEYTVDAFNHTFGRNMVPEDGTEDGKALILPSNFALNIHKIEVVDGKVYDPRQESGSKPYFTLEGRKFVNTFLESSVPKATPVKANKAEKLVKRLLHENLKHPEYERVVLDFLAFCVQFPGRKIRWAIFLQGGQGCGKGTLMDTVQASIGRANMKVVTGSALTSDFNDWREGSQLNYIDELFSAGSNRHEINNKLKDAISNTVIPVNRKFKDLTNIPNVTNYFLTTNKHDALVLEDSDRRYFVLKSRLQTRRQVTAFAETGIMDKIHKLIEDNPGAFRQFYLDHEISADFNPNGHAPETVFRHELIDQGKNPLLIQIEDLIDDPEHPLIGQDLIHYAQLERKVEILAKNNSRPSHYLHTLGYRALEESKIFTVAGERTRIYAHVDHWVEGFDDPVEILESRMNDKV